MRLLPRTSSRLVKQWRNLRRYYEDSFTHSYGCRFIFYVVPLARRRMHDEGIAAASSD